MCILYFLTIRHLVSLPKNRTPDLHKLSVVYKIPCATCPSGQTGSRLCQRLGEPKRAVKDADFNSSALVEHAWTEGHPVDWQSVSVLSSCPDYHYRLVKETILIRTSTSVWNRDTGTLPPEYDN